MQEGIRVQIFWVVRLATVIVASVLAIRRPPDPGLGRTWADFETEVDANKVGSCQVFCY